MKHRASSKTKINFLNHFWNDFVQYFLSRSARNTGSAIVSVEYTRFNITWRNSRVHSTYISLLLCFCCCDVVVVVARIYGCCLFLLNLCSDITLWLFCHEESKIFWTVFILARPLYDVLPASIWRRLTVEYLYTFSIHFSYTTILSH